MTNEELLKPRWKCIADFPDSKYKIGQIYDGFEFEDNIFISPKDFGYSDTPIDIPEDYPAIFKKLEWWEERNKEDLPKYIKHKLDNIILKVYEYGRYDAWFYQEEDGVTYTPALPIKHFDPATKEEYEQQQNRS